MAVTIANPFSPAELTALLRRLTGITGDITVTGDPTEAGAQVSSTEWSDPTITMAVGRLPYHPREPAPPAPNPLGGYVGIQTSPVAGAISVKEPWLDIRERGAKVDGVTDDSAAVLSALQSVPAYAAGAGGGAVFFPAGITQTGSAASLAHALTSGITLKGAGKQSSLLRGAIAGPLISTPNDGTSNPLTAYPAIEDMSLINTSTDAAAKAAQFDQASDLCCRGVHFQSSATGDDSSVVGAIALIVTDFWDTHFGGVAGPDWGFAAFGSQGQCNILGFHGSSFTDTKGALLAVNGHSLTVNDGCHFESLTGGAHTSPSVISVDGWTGITIGGNYAESNAVSFLLIYNAFGFSYGLDLGVNFLTNQASPFIGLGHISFARVAPQIMVPGAISPNANGIIGLATATEVHIAPQRLASGTGLAVDAHPADAGSVSEAFNGIYTIGTVAGLGGLITGAAGTTQGPRLWGGAGAPAAGLGTAGDYYFREDTPATANQRVYVNNAGAWTGIL